MTSVIVVGAQWGDEGKGKVIDLLSKHVTHVVRAQGGNNAGHTLVVGDIEYKLHLVPSGIVYPHTQCFIGAGTVIDPEVLLKEMNNLESHGIVIRGRLWLSEAAHLIFPYHKLYDRLLEKRKGEGAIGTTGLGIGPCYADKVNRIGIRVGDLMRADVFLKKLETVVALKNEELHKLYGEDSLDLKAMSSLYLGYAEKLKPFIADVEARIGSALKKGNDALFEGAQGTFLDISLGTYPYVTSSNTLAGGICAGAGVGPTQIDHTIGVVKAYTTRVGHGPLPTAVSEEEQFLDHREAREFGTTTGRKRRVGWFDAVLVSRSVCLNGIDSIALTKLDILDNAKVIKICTGYQLDGRKCEEMPSLIEDLERVVPVYEEVPGWLTSTREIKEYEKLPINARRYLERIEVLCGVPVQMISVGPERERTIIRKPYFP